MTERFNTKPVAGILTLKSFEVRLLLFSGAIGVLVDKY
jgi:hypothetical protein